MTFLSHSNNIGDKIIQEKKLLNENNLSIVKEKVIELNLQEFNLFSLSY